MKKIYINFAMCVCIIFAMNSYVTSAASLKAVDTGTVVIEKGNKAILKTNVTDGYPPVVDKKANAKQKKQQKIIVKSSNKKVATINKYGVVKGKKAGKAKVTISIGGKKKTHTWNIVVKNKLKPKEMFAYEVKIDEEGKKYVEITKYKAYNAKVYIPENINHIPVKVFSARIGSKANTEKEKRYVEEITFAQGIYEIASEAFCGVPTLKKVMLPGTLSKMGEAVFAESHRLEEVNFTEICDLGYIPARTFEECERLNIDLFFTSSVSKIENRAFYKSGAHKITLSEGLREIDKEAFMYSDVEEVIIPSTVERIGEKAFACLAFRTLTNQSENAMIEPNAFWKSMIGIGEVETQEGTLHFVPFGFAREERAFERDKETWSLTK